MILEGEVVLKGGAVSDERLSQTGKCVGDGEKWWGLEEQGSALGVGWIWRQRVTLSRG